MPHTRLGRLAATLLLAALAALPCAAQDAEKPEAKPDAPTEAVTTTGTPELTPELIDARIKEMEGSALDEETTKRAVEAYQQARAALKAAEAAAAEQARADRLREEAPAEIEKLRAQIAAPAPEAPVTIPEDATIETIEQMLADARAALSEARMAQKKLESDIKARPAQREQLPRDIAEARRKLEEVTAALSAKPPEDQPTPVTQALRAERRARKKALEEQIAALEKQLIAHDVAGRLQSAAKELADRRATLAEKRIPPIEEALNALRRAAETEARRKAQADREAARDEHPVIKRIAEENDRLVTPLTTKIIALEQRARSLQERIADLNSDYEIMADKVSKAASISKAIGLWLRNKRRDIPDLHPHREHIKELEAEGFRIALEKLDWQERVEDLASLEDELAAVSARLGADLPPAERALIETRAEALLTTRREGLAKLIKNVDDYQATLVDVEQRERQLVEAAERNAQFIDEHVLWIPSAPAFGLHSAGEAIEAAAWLTLPANWTEVFRALGHDAARRWFHWGPVLLLALLLALLRPRLRGRLAQRAEALSNPETDLFRHTLAALALTTLLALPLPLLLGYVARRLALMSNVPPFGGVLSDGLMAAAMLLFPLAFIRNACIQNGLVPAHFRWRGNAPGLLRRDALLLMVTAVPLLAVAAMLQSTWQTEELWNHSLGRVAFVAAMLALSGVMAALLRPNGAVVRETIARGQGGWLYRGRYLWHALTTVLPVALALAALAGYYYTALQLERRLQTSLLVVLVIILANLLLARLIFVLRRRLALKKARRRERERREEKAKEGAGAADADASVGRHPVEELNLYTINVQTRRLLATFTLAALLVGLWAIWADVLPALQIFNKVELWRTGVTEQGAPSWITLGHLMVSLLIVIVTVAAARNIPGVLEIALLRRLSIDQGARFAIATLARYAMTIIGLAFAFKAIGIGWAKVQWLAAAVTFGLGFGLQEIFANFVSGLIILFERPMRLGDVVTVGETVGTVTRIQIRATTITDRDRHELIVPNKEFVTGRLINWTLSDSTLRVVIPVGIAYGSDIHLARRTLLQAAEECPMVIDKPEPEALFLGFGNSALEFELRCFIATYDHYFRVIHALHEWIDTSFREAGIEIAFPQHDLHLRSADVPLSLRRAPGEAEGPDEA